MGLSGTRRDAGKFAVGGAIASMTGVGLGMGGGSAKAEELAPSLLSYLSGLDAAVEELANTWKPDDPAYRADVYRQVMMNLSYAYFALFHATPEHPDWAPLWNPVYLQQPNPDTLYLYAPLRGDLTYRISGDRGTCHGLVFATQQGFSGFSSSIEGIKDIRLFDVRDMEVGPDGEFELLLGSKKPEGYEGNWAEVTPGTDTLMVRYISLDWGTERDPQLSIECLDDVPPKPRLTPSEIVQKIEKMAAFPGNMNKLFFPMQNDLKERLGVNAFDVFVMPGVDFQAYWPAAFEFSPGEALIIETELPEDCFYWNLQLNDPYFNAIEFVYRLSSTNNHFAKISSDGKFRAVVSLEDPGVPNWLDPAGFTEGTLWGRWFDCSTQPKPTLQRVSLADVRKHLPEDTPTVTPEERAEELRSRVRAAQRRRRW